MKRASSAGKNKTMNQINMLLSDCCTPTSQCNHAGSCRIVGFCPLWPLCSVCVQLSHTFGQAATQICSSLYIQDTEMQGQRAEERHGDCDVTGYQLYTLHNVISCPKIDAQKCHDHSKILFSAPLNLKRCIVFFSVRARKFLQYRHMIHLQQATAQKFEVNQWSETGTLWVHTT